MPRTKRDSWAEMHVHEKQKALTLTEAFYKVPQPNALECQAMKKPHSYLICACL